jgi:hypothetical protein
MGARTEAEVKKEIENEKNECITTLLIILYSVSLAISHHHSQSRHPLRHCWRPSARSKRAAVISTTHPRPRTARKTVHVRRTKRSRNTTRTARSAGRANLAVASSAGQPESILLAVRLAVELVVSISQSHAALPTLEAPDVVLDARRCVFQVLAFDAAPAAAAETAVELVVVQFAVRAVIKHVEGCCWERLFARGADEACLVVPACETAVGARDRLARDGFAAGSAKAAVGWRSWHPGLGFRTHVRRRPGWLFGFWRRLSRLFLLLLLLLLILWLGRWRLGLWRLALLFRSLRRPGPPRGRKRFSRTGREGRWSVGHEGHGGLRSDRGSGDRGPSPLVGCLQERIDARVVAALTRRSGAWRGRSPDLVPGDDFQRRDPGGLGRLREFVGWRLEIVKVLIGWFFSRPRAQRPWRARPRTRLACLTGPAFRTAAVVRVVG